ncbi:MAG TPA: ABC transporter ATP-binding protein [Thermomicrobiales bacterium]|nr:ABC transporter ATP-binding protein [Thermomicrobiales bacterium]
MSKPLLEIENLRVTFPTPRGDLDVVRGISFTLGRERLGIVGESGSGKSMTGRSILKLIRAPGRVSADRLSFDGIDLRGRSERQMRAIRGARISMVMQDPKFSLNPVMTIGDQIVDAIHAHDRKLSDRKARERAAEMLRIVGIEETRIDSYPHQLSGGMRQRAVIAIALVMNPPLMIMDEPTTALDVVVQREIMAQIADLKERLGFSILFITHDISLLVEISDRIAIMYAGQIVEMARARDLFDEPLHPYTQGLMSSFPSLTGPRMALTGIPGSPPNLITPPTGCRFHPRCPKRMMICDHVVPKLAEARPDHWVACHLYPESLPEQIEPGALEPHPQRVTMITEEGVV